MISYLSLKRKKPTKEPTPMANATITLTSSNNSSIISESSHPPLLLNAIPNQSMKDIIAMIKNIFWRLFISQFNTFLLIGCCDTSTIGVSYANG